MARAKRSAAARQSGVDHGGAQPWQARQPQAHRQGRGRSQRCNARPGNGAGGQPASDVWPQSAPGAGAKRPDRGRRGRCARRERAPFLLHASCLFPKPAWPALLPSLAARLRCPSCWCAPRTPCVPGVSARPVATAPAASAARPGLDAGATGALHCAALEGGRTTPQQLAALRQHCQGRGERTSRQEEAGILGFRGRTGLQGPQHTARPAKDQSNYSLERSEPQSPLVEGEGG